MTNDFDTPDVRRLSLMSTTCRRDVAACKQSAYLFGELKFLVCDVLFVSDGGRAGERLENNQ
jgi:hypothetical protein